MDSTVKLFAEIPHTNNYNYFYTLEIAFDSIVRRGVNLNPEEVQTILSGIDHIIYVCNNEERTLIESHTIYKLKALLKMIYERCEDKTKAREVRERLDELNNLLVINARYGFL